MGTEDCKVRRVENISITKRLFCTGCPSKIPSDIVEKILNTLKESEKELRRKHSILSMTSSSSFGVSAIPSRFHLMNPAKKTVHTIVDQVSKSTKSFNGLEPSTPLVKPENNDEQSVIIDEEPSGCVSSDYSDDSDWSDEEKEKLEKLFGEMSVRAVDSEKKRQLRKSRGESRKSNASSVGASSWNIAQLVCSRDSSISSSHIATSLHSSGL
jgi:hypothetical protein